MTDMIENTEEFVEGRADGEKWAKSTATPRELRMVEQIMYDYEEELYGVFNGIDLCDSAAALFYAIHPECRDDGAAWLAFWRKVSSRSDTAGAEFAEDIDYLSGFHAGALAVWREMKDRL
jgi:hypothetical protein